MKKTTQFYVNRYKIVDRFMENYGDIDFVIEGVLIDSFLGYFKSEKFYKYFIILENYLTPYSSNQKVIFTNDEKLFDHWYNVFEQEQEN